MGTRSRIGYYEPKDGMIHSITCHWDGYLSSNGKTLVEHYKDIRKIRRLIALGSISSLEAYVSPKEAPKPLVPRYNTSKYPKGWKHSYETPAKDVTIAQARDMDYPLDAILITNAFQDYSEYNYLYKRGVWAYNKNGAGGWHSIPTDYKELVEA